MEKEVWKPVKGFEGFYEVSSFGRVRSVSRWLPCARNPQKQQWYHGRILKSRVNMRGTREKGYLVVPLSRKGVVHHSQLVHRLVAGAFIPNPEGLREVNHIDGDKLNNHVENLEWVSSSQNKLHAHQSMLYSNEKPVECIETGDTFRTQKEAGLVYEVHPNSIGRACLGKNKTSAGFHWRFL